MVTRRLPDRPRLHVFMESDEKGHRPEKTPPGELVPQGVPQKLVEASTELNNVLFSLVGVAGLEPATR
jgi:hypothetical protein